MYRWMLRRPHRAPLVTGVLGFALAAAASLALGWPPAPVIHDEFSYLLASDTFAHGRLTNLTPPFWQHFETFHVLQVPSYASKYPPGSALFLALGQILTGQPIVGVWIGYALMCAAVTWMFQAWLRPRWALWGGVLTTLWFVCLPGGGVYWASAYWGGAVAAAGGALVLGGARRITRATSRPRARDSLATGIGLLLLANTRPFEGFFFALPIAVSTLWWSSNALRARGRRDAITGLGPAFFTLLVGAMLMAGYNKAVTGDPLRFPYTAYEQQYASSPSLLGMSAPPVPTYHNEAMRCFYLTGIGHADAPSSFPEYVRSLWRRSHPLMQGLFPFFVLPLFLAAPCVIRRDRPWLPLISIGTTTATFLVNPWILLLHYAAPFIAAYFLFLTLSARRLHLWRLPTFRIGVALTRLVMVIVGVFAVASVVGIAILRPVLHNAWYWKRAAIEETLSQTPGRHIVLVKYGSHHNNPSEWVHNGADIDRSKVIWARAMAHDDDARLLRYFSDRHAWLLRIEDNSGPFTLTPIDSASFSADSARVVPLRRTPEQPALTKAECRP
jgi:hypothetical protein